MGHVGGERIAAGEVVVEELERIDAPEDLAVRERGRDAEDAGGDGRLGVAAQSVFGVGGVRAGD